MAKIVIKSDGKLPIPEEFYLSRALNLVPAYAGTAGSTKIGQEVYIWPSEDGFVLQFPSADVRRVYIEVTLLCNLNCITCIRNAWSDETGHMDMDIFRTIVQQLKDFPHIQSVTLAGFGEPLYHPEILSITRAIKEMGLELTISTNGTLLSQDIAEELVNIGLDRLIVSLDSCHPKMFGDIRAGANLDLVMGNLKELNEIKRRRRSKYPVVGIEFVAMRRNVHEIADLPRLGSLLGASFIIISNLLPHTEDMKGEILYDAIPELPKSVGWPVHVGDSWMVWGTISYPRMRWGADRNCRFVHDRSFVIGWDGSVSPCYALMHSYSYYIFGRRKEVSRYVIGNMREKRWGTAIALPIPLLELWTCEEYVRFRSKVRSFAFPSCVDCGIDCGYTNINQDCWGSDPSCADCLYAQGIIRCP